MENLCVSLEWAQKMKDKGFKQISSFYFIPKVTKSFLGFILSTSKEEYELAHPMIKPASEALKDCYSAYTFQELSDIIPRNIKHENIEYNLVISFLSDKIQVGYIDYHYDTEEVFRYDFYAENIKCADAMAEIACYLKDEGIIK
jgi:hypothetical protein